MQMFCLVKGSHYYVDKKFSTFDYPQGIVWVIAQVSPIEGGTGWWTFGVGLQKLYSLNPTIFVTT